VDKTGETGHPRSRLVQRRLPPVPESAPRGEGSRAERPAPWATRGVWPGGGAAPSDTGLLEPRGQAGRAGLSLRRSTFGKGRESVLRPTPNRQQSTDGFILRGASDASPDPRASRARGDPGGTIAAQPSRRTATGRADTACSRRADRGTSGRYALLSVAFGHGHGW